MRNRAVSATLAVRFEEKVNRTPGQGPDGQCHIWTAAVSTTGYGKLSVARSTWDGAHRVAWFLATGEWPDVFVLHTCDTRTCVRFEHLFLGTHKDNMRDMVAKERHRRGSDCYNAKLTPDSVREIRRLSGVLPNAEIARRLGISDDNVGHVLRGETWRWVA